MLPVKGWWDEEGRGEHATLRVGEAYLTSHTKEDNRTHRCVWDFPSLTGNG